MKFMIIDEKKLLEAKTKKVLFEETSIAVGELNTLRELPAEKCFRTAFEIWQDEQKNKSLRGVEKNTCSTSKGCDKNDKKRIQ